MTQLNEIKEYITRMAPLVIFVLGFELLVLLLLYKSSEVSNKLSEYWANYLTVVIVFMILNTALFYAMYSIANDNLKDISDRDNEMFERCSYCGVKQ
jgi:fumarate reductase subunit D